MKVCFPNSTHCFELLTLASFFKDGFYFLLGVFNFKVLYFHHFPNKKKKQYHFMVTHFTTDVSIISYLLKHCNLWKRNFLSYRQSVNWLHVKSLQKEKRKHLLASLIETSPQGQQWAHNVSIGPTLLQSDVSFNINPLWRIHHIPYSSLLSRNPD